MRVHIVFSRYKNCFFQKRESKDQAERALLRLLKLEVEAYANSRSNSVELREEVQELPGSGLAGVLQQLRQQGPQARAEDGEGDRDDKRYQMMRRKIIVMIAGYV